MSVSTFTVHNLTFDSGSETDGRRIAREMMAEIGRQVRIATATGAGFVGD